MMNESTEILAKKINEENDSYERRMFTLAHEIGHIVLHKELIQKKGGQDIAYRMDLQSSSDIKMEREANEFAANLLMPQQLFRWLYLKFNGDLGEVAAELRVSFQAASIRAELLELNRMGI